MYSLTNLPKIEMKCDLQDLKITNQLERNSASHVSAVESYRLNPLASYREPFNPL